MDEAQVRIGSPQFAEWMAFYLVEAEMSGLIERPPTPDELGDKLTAWAAIHNAAPKHGEVARERR